MTRRLVALLVVACASGAAAITISNGRADRPSTPAARLPAIPAAAPVAERCPIAPRFRRSFVDAARETGLPLALLTAVARAESELDRSSPRAEVLSGARYLQALLDRLPSRELALAEYSGRSADDATLTYVADVTSIWRSLAGCR